MKVDSAAMLSVGLWVGLWAVCVCGDGGQFDPLTLVLINGRNKITQASVYHMKVILWAATGACKEGVWHWKYYLLMLFVLMHLR